MKEKASRDPHMRSRSVDEFYERHWRSKERTIVMEISDFILRSMAKELNEQDGIGFLGTSEKVFERLSVIPKYAETGTLLQFKRGWLEPEPFTPDLLIKYKFTHVYWLAHSYHPDDHDEEIS